MASFLYNRFKYNLANKQIDLDNDTLKIILLANTYTPDKDHNTLSDIQSDEVSGSGYSAGGITIDNPVLTQDDANDRAKFDADNTTFSGVDVTFRYAAIYDDTVSGDPLIGLLDFGEDITVENGDIIINYNTSGIILITG